MSSSTPQRPPYFDPSYWELLPAVDSTFVHASERLGGTVDFRYSIPHREDSVPSQTLKRILFARPFHIFRDIVAQQSIKSDRLASFNSNIRVGYIRSNVPNAFCWQENHLTFLGVTSGLVHFIHGFVAHLLSFREFLTAQIDGANEEEDGKVAEIADGIDFDSILDWKSENDFFTVRYRQPKSHSRALMAINIAHLAILFVFLHELGHAYYGHNEFIGRFRRRKLIHEMYKSKNNDGLSYLSQRFELLADSFAIDVSLRTRLGAYNSALEDASDYSQWSLGVDLILWMFSQRSKLGPNKGSHPHPQLRLLVKALHIARSNYGVPGRDIDYAPIGQKPISDLCNSMSVALFDFWKSNRLPGWDTSFINQNIIADNYSILEDIQWKPDKAWLEYEKWVDLTLVEDSIGRPKYSDDFFAHPA